MKNKGITTLVLAGAMLFSGMGIRQTYSYFSQKEVVNNVFTVGDLKISLTEPEWEPEKGDGTNIYPGYTAYKNPTVRNIGETEGKSQPCYLKMHLRILDGDGELITDEERLNLIKETIRYDRSYNGNSRKKGTATGLAEGYATGYSLEEIRKFPMVNPDFFLMSYDTGESTFGYQGEKDSILQLGAETTLFTTVVFPTEWTDKELELIGEFQLEITAEAIQASGFADRAAAFAVMEEA